MAFESAFHIAKYGFCAIYVFVCADIWWGDIDIDILHDQNEPFKI